MSIFARIVVLMVLALWGLATMHCKLEVLPGLEFIKSCCNADAASDPHKNCENDGCNAVENGQYRLEEQTASAPQPLLILTLLAAVIESPPPGIQTAGFAALESPPELPKIWQFSQRTALSPRAPSFAS